MREAAKVSVEFVQQMNEKFPRVNEWDEEYAVVVGKRWDKIVKRRPNDPYAMSAEAFVDPENGLMYKPAGWSAPAKGARFDLTKGVEKVVAMANRSGGYLYAR
jgi:hypothetical protein